MLYPAELWAHLSRLPYVLVLGVTRHPTLRSTAEWLRRGGDSNPRYPFEVQRLSRAPDSATLAPLQFKPPPGAGERLPRNPSTSRVRVESGGGGNMSGEGGIRTPGTAERLNGFQDRLLRPLGHLSRAQKTRPPQSARGKERPRISSLSSPVHYTHRPGLCQQNWPFARSARTSRGDSISGSGGFSPDRLKKSRRSGSCPCWRSLSLRLLCRAFR